MGKTCGTREEKWTCGHTGLALPQSTRWPGIPLSLLGFRFMTYTTETLGVTEGCNGALLFLNPALHVTTSASYSTY